MVSYTFKWLHAGDEVYVTGTFDNWSKSEKMDKVADKFEKSVELVNSSEKIYYKFVVDGTWTVNPTDPKEKDESGNENNVLTPEDLLKTYVTAATVNSVSADATTAQLAKDIPLEKDKKAETETETETETQTDAKPSGIPGTFPETPADELNKPIGISPLPAAVAGLNPIKLTPGEPIPNDIKTAGSHANVKLDPESYENSDALPGVDPKDFNLPPITSTMMIPESSLPMGSASPNINSVSAHSTTAALAAQVPKEPKVTEAVKSSQEKAGTDPEASGIADEVEAKRTVENELKEKATEVPSPSEGLGRRVTNDSERDKKPPENASAAATGDVAAPIAADEVLSDPAKERVADTAPKVPSDVKESMVETGKSSEAVEEKEGIGAEPLKDAKIAEYADDAKPEPTKVTEEAPKVVADVPKNSEPAGNETANGTTPANGVRPPATPTKAATTDVVTPTSSQRKKNRISGFFGKIKSKIAHKEGGN